MDLTSRNRFLSIVLIFLVNLNLPSFVHSSYFRKIPKEQYFEPQGLTIELPCITDRKDVACAWLRDGSIMIPSAQNYKNNYNYSQHSSTGDCSLIINDLTYPKDNAQWECQVPSADFDSAFKWPKTKVVVLVKPSPPKIQENLETTLIIADQLSTLTCESNEGNPVPSLEWYLNGENITANATRIVNSKPNRFISKLSYTFKKKNNASTLACVSVHQLENQNTTRLLNVLYKPIVTVEHKMYTVLENHNESIECLVDANPHSMPFWKPSMTGNNVENHYKVNGGKLSLLNVNHRMDGIDFQCSSQNDIGMSEPFSVKINVLYKPRLIETGNQQMDIKVGNELRLHCNFIGNPRPVIRWRVVDSIYSQEKFVQVSPENPEILIIQNVSYLNEGDYYCEGENTIQNNEFIVKSNKFAVNVNGKAQLLKEQIDIVGYQNMDTRIEQEFCSDPPPTEVHWVYGGSTQHIVDINGKDRKFENAILNDSEEESHIIAGPLMPIDLKSPNPTCFKVALLIRNTDIADARDYTIVVKNDESLVEGVESKISISMVVFIMLIVLIMLFLSTVMFILILRRRSSNKKNEDSEDKSDVRVPINDSSDDDAKRSDEKNDNVQVYANIDFIGNDLTNNRQFQLKHEPTLYAKISFNS